MRWPKLPGSSGAFIYGSWAARYAQRSGPVPADTDLLVVGRPDRGKLDDAVAGAESAIRREVNVRRVTADAWNEDDSSFKRTVLSRPVVDMIGKHDE